MAMTCDPVNGELHDRPVNVCHLVPAVIEGTYCKPSEPAWERYATMYRKPPPPRTPRGSRPACVDNALIVDTPRKRKKPTFWIDESALDKSTPDESEPDPKRVRQDNEGEDTKADAKKGSKGADKKKPPKKKPPKKRRKKQGGGNAGTEPASSLREHSEEEEDGQSDLHQDIDGNDEGGSKGHWAVQWVPGPGGSQPFAPMPQFPPQIAPPIVPQTALHSPMDLCSGQFPHAPVLPECRNIGSALPLSHLSREPFHHSTMPEPFSNGFAEPYCAALVRLAEREQQWKQNYLCFQLGLNAASPVPKTLGLNAASAVPKTQEEEH
eukprot:m.339457 g.339457  ORF g.339457 m.339457 type:complete len:323 (-) comp16542_c1_seq29:1625-2593(-)